MARGMAGTPCDFCTDPAAHCSALATERKAREKAERKCDEQRVRADTFAGEHVWAINSLENAGVVGKRIHHGIDTLSHRAHKAEAALAVREKERDEAQLLADGFEEGSAEWEEEAKDYKAKLQAVTARDATSREALRRAWDTLRNSTDASLEGKHLLAAHLAAVANEVHEALANPSPAAEKLLERAKRTEEAEAREADALAGQAAMVEALEYVSPERLEIISNRVHEAYLETCKRLGWTVKTENQVAYIHLPPDSQELARASARAVIDELRQYVLANLPALARLADDSPSTPRARLDVLLHYARDQLGHSNWSMEPGELVILRALEEALAGQAVLLKALECQACMCTSHRVCARCEALTNRSGRVREIMAAVRIAPKLIDMLSQVPVEILWTRQCRHDLLNSEDAKLVLGACKIRLKVLNSGPGVNKEAP